MDAKSAIDSFMQDATGGKAGGRHQFSMLKRSFIASDTAKALREQWNAAGRDQAYVLLRLTEADGSNPHHVTAWDGKDTFVCFTESGLAYAQYRKLQEMKIDETWDPKSRLVTLRTPVLKESMERGDVHTLLDRVRKTLIKSGKVRRGSRFKNMAKFFESDEPGPEVAVSDEGKAKNSIKMPKTSSKLSTAMVPAPKPGQEVPEEPPGRDKFMKTGRKVDKKAESVSYDWRNIDESGRVMRRPLKHAFMKGKDQPVKPVDLRDEECDPQLDKRNKVDQRSEGGKNQGDSSGDGNKTDAQLDKRTTVDLRMEDAACGACPFKGKMRSYDGESVTCPECGARQDVKVRTEEKDGKAFGHPLSDCKKFHPKKSHKEWINTRGNLNARGSKTESEAFEHPGSTCATFHPGKSHQTWADQRWNLTSRGSKMEAAKLKGDNLFGHSKPAADSKKPDADSGHGHFDGKKAGLFGAKKPLLMIMLMKKGKSAPKTTMEEGHRFFANPEHAEKHGAKFLANIERMRAGKMGKKTGKRKGSIG